MSLEVTVASATNLPNLEARGKIDPYVKVEFQGVSKKTAVIKSELNPVWNETLVFDLKGQPLRAQDEMKLCVLDWERVGRNRSVGACNVPMNNILKAGAHPTTFNLSLSDANQRSVGAVIVITVKYTAPSGVTDQQHPSETGGLSNADESAADGEMATDVDGGTAAGDGGGDTATANDPTSASHGRPVRKSGPAKKQRGVLSTKPQDFQVRIKLIEGRQLQGTNISPLCRVTLRKQVKESQICSSTNSPCFNTNLVFNFNVSLAELVDDQIEFSVINSRKMRSDALIGSFKCDVGTMYDEPQHSLINKWLLLTVPDDNQLNPAGYLKICASLVGPGDDAPNLGSLEKQADEEDIESNLLRPAGIELRPATFKLKVYRAEDIPRMDSDFMQGIKQVFGSDEKKEFVDPYFVCSFAGKKVTSKVLYNCDHPEWNQELKIGINFPSMCEKIKLKLMDWDRLTAHDNIATSYIDIIKTSRAGTDATEDDGFLPTFGPCFINFYGAPREYSELPTEYEDLNKGKGEGVAFRGRVLVELQTVVGEKPKKTVDDLLTEDLTRVEKFLRRRKFRLHAAMLDASMISAIDAPVEFEVSIGNYGNKLDENLPPCVSTTQPTNAVFDGCNYYFLPWANSKPCVAVDCQWEDITFRLESLNMLLAIHERLDVNISRLNLAQKAKLPIAEQAQLLVALLDQLITDCKQPLPNVTSSANVETELDRNVRYYRQVELLAMAGEAAILRDSATDIEEALVKIGCFSSTLKNMCNEPQNSIPDIFIWMLAGDKRVAYYRCPAHLVLWSENPSYRGKFCGQLETLALKFPGNKAERDNRWDIPALLRIKIWFGLEQHESQWYKMQTEGDLVTFAETYENQISILGNWTNKGPAMSRPKWSDATGKIELNKDDFILPPGWRWDSDWYISPELSMLFDKDAGHRDFMEDIYECQSRIPGTAWGPATVSWTDVKGDATAGKDEVELPAGWEWKDEWQVDLNRAVDDNGFEYTVESTLGGYGPVEKTYHLCRRRRWVRTRHLVMKTELKPAAKAKKPADTEGWEYAPLFTMKFHSKDRRMDLVRRRRWHRKMVADSTSFESGASCVFQIASKKSKDNDEPSKALSAAPRMFLVCQKLYRFQLRAYIYQARNLLAGDSSGYSDPFARVVLLNQSQTTETLKKTLCPTWDQTLVFDCIEIHGELESIAEKPPKIIVELFDHDSFGSATFLGRMESSPSVKLNSSRSPRTMLQWFDLNKGDKMAGELLAAFELISTENNEVPLLPSKRGHVFMVPSGIRPQLQRTGIEVMCWGVRNMRTFQLASVLSPNVEIEVGGQIVRSKAIHNTTRNPNFSEAVLFFDIMLPTEELYCPPVNIYVRDNRPFGRKPKVGVHSIKSLESYRCEPIANDQDQTDSCDPVDDVTVDDAVIDIDMKPSGDHVIDMTAISSLTQSTAVPQAADIDWWSKYYASVGRLDKCKQYLEQGYDKIQVYNSELEKSADFKGFTDFARSFVLTRGKNAEEEETAVAGQFKGQLHIYPLPDDPAAPLPQKVLRNLPSSSPMECVVRVYIIRAFDLQPSDPNGLADPYIQIRLGKVRMDTCSDYIPNTLNPVFGKMFEMKTVIPVAKDLRIRIKDFDLLTSNDIIGETVIDLENRLLTQHGALVGLPQTYCTSGVCEWRNSRKPSQLLEEFCKRRLGVTPVYRGNAVLTVGRRVFRLSDYEHSKPPHRHLGAADERLALHVLNSLPKSLGISLVPEHVETRPLYTRLQPGIEQGKLQMWVDIYPTQFGPPGPFVDIKPRMAKRFELRIIIWNTKDVILQETSVTGEKMSDIYVKGWINGVNDKQETDVHYRSLDGEGNFNWRFVFPFDYLPEEENVVVKKKEKFWSLDKSEMKLPAVLNLQVWDNDKLSSDDILGTLELKLNSMPMPAKNSRSCTLNMLPTVNKTNASSSRRDVKLVSLFEQKRIRGFWPCSADTGGQQKLTGKIEMEIELLTEDEARDRPAGRARDEPNQHPTLEPPKRPETSFLWFASPWKTFRLIVWRRYKMYFITGLLLLVLLIFVILFIYAIPGAAVSKIFGTM